jgi:nicotinic acid mononucleotide adenylyltransferase
MTDFNLEALRDSGYKIYLTTTGAGAGIQNEIWKVAGCSSFFVGASFPYARDKTIQFLGYEPKQFTSRETTIDLAVASYKRALSSCKGTDQPVGIGVCASVTSLEEHKGDHRYYVCVITPTEIKGFSETMEKPESDYHRSDPEGIRRYRNRDGNQIDYYSLRILMQVLGFGNFEVQVEDWNNLATTLFFEHPLWHPDGRRSSDEYLKTTKNHRFFPGSFNPPHMGHICMASEIEDSKGERPVFMIERQPPHKEKLSVQEMIRRRILLKDETVLFTDGAPLFIEKARLYPFSWFVIGADTVLRMLDPFWGPQIKDMLSEFDTLGTRFHVFGRKVEGRLWKSSEVSKMMEFNYPDHNYGMFIYHDGLWDISSTQLRRELVG